MAMSKSVAEKNRYSECNKISLSRSVADVPISKLFFTISVFLLSLNFMLYCTGLAAGLKSQLRLVAVIGFVIALLFELRSIKLSVIEILIVGLLLISFLYHGESSLNLLLVVLFILVSRRLGEKYATKIIAVSAVILIALNLVLLFAHVLPDFSYISTKGRFRRTLGFENPNQTSLFFCAAITLVLIPKFRKSLFFAALFAFLLYIANVTDTRGLYACCIVFCTCYILFLLSYHFGHNGLPAVISTGVLAFVVVGSFALPLLENTPVNDLLSGRPSLFSAFASNLTISDWITGSPVNFSLDNFYLVAVANYGLPLLVLLLIVIQRAIVNLAIHAEVSKLAFICGVLAYSFVESFLFRPELLITLAFWCVVFCNAGIYEDLGSVPRD